MLLFELNRVELELRLQIRELTNMDLQCEQFKCVIIKTQLKYVELYSYNKNKKLAFRGYNNIHVITC